MAAELVTFEPVCAGAAGDPALREQLLDTWVRVTDTGGAVGFVAPADRAAHAEALDAALARIAAGRDALGILRRAGDGDAVGMGILARSSSPLRSHWRTIVRLMVDPSLQGAGAGRVLLEGLHGVAADLGLEFVTLSVRGGLGLEGFYGHLGYEAVGRNPHSIRVAPGDDRDEIFMRRAL